MMAAISQTELLFSNVVPPFYVIGAFALLFIVYASGTIMYNVWFHPLSKYPGPKLMAVTFIPHSWLIWNGQEHIVFKQLHDKYGDVFRCGPDALSFVGATAWKDIYGYRPGMKQIPKDPTFYEPAGEEAANIIFCSDEDHSRFRRTLSNAFSEKALRSSESILNVYFDLLISRLKDRASSPNSVVDITAWYNWTTFDIIGDLAFGESFHALENAAYHPYIWAIGESLSFGRFFRIARHFGLQWLLLDIVLIIARFNAGLRKGMHSLKGGYAKEILAKRLTPERKMVDRQDFIYHILRQEEGKGMNSEELERNANLLVVAGSETTATLLSGTTYHLLQNPQVLQTLTNEVRGAFKSAEEITLASTISSKMPYLHAVLEEGLRMYPPVATKLPRRTTHETIINGDVIPPKISVGVSQYASSRDANSYHSPNTFEPARWLPSPPAPYDHDKLDGNQPFSIGPRNCLGKNLAYGEMRSILAQMVWNFDLSFAKDEKGRVLSENWDIQKTYALWVKGPLLVDLKVRE